jgi:hypothetical protein
MAEAAAANGSPHAPHLENETDPLRLLDARVQSRIPMSTTGGLCDRRVIARASSFPRAFSPEGDTEPLS